MNYRDIRDIKPPQTANNFFRPGREANNNIQNFTILYLIVKISTFVIL